MILNIDMGALCHIRIKSHYVLRTKKAGHFYEYKEKVLFKTSKPYEHVAMVYLSNMLAL